MFLRTGLISWKLYDFVCYVESTKSIGIISIETNEQAPTAECELSIGGDLIHGYYYVTSAVIYEGQPVEARRF